MEIKDMEVGDIVYCRLTGNASRGKTGDELIQEWEIVKIGRKYVTAKRKGWSNSRVIQFEIDKNYKEKTNYCTDYILYVNKQDILDEFEIGNLQNWFKKEFDVYGRTRFSIEQLRKAKEILSE